MSGKERQRRSFRVLQDQFIEPTMNAILLGWQATRLLRTATFCSTVQSVFSEAGFVVSPILPSIL